MTTETLTNVDVRRAAKVILHVDDTEKLLFVAGKRGMWNLPGGGIDTVTADGIDYEESPEDALLRELQEELGVEEFQLGNLAETCGTWGEVDTADGHRKKAVWSVFTGDLRVPSRELVLPAESEITAIAALTPVECLNHRNMSKLAKYAVRHMFFEK